MLVGFLPPRSLVKFALYRFAALTACGARMAAFALRGWPAVLRWPLEQVLLGIYSK